MDMLYRLRATCTNRIFLFFLLVAVAFMASCAGTGSHGKLVHNDKVKKAFETYQIPPNHSYYYSGPDDLPRAVIGIRNEYHLESKFWKTVDLTPTRLKRWLEMNGRPRPEYDFNKNGSEILSPDGTQIGIWYAIKNWKERATVKMIDDKTVNID